VSALTLNSVVYGTTSITNTVASPNSFQLTVVDPCQTASFNVNSLSNMTTSVNAAPALMPQNIRPSTVSASATITCGKISYTLN
jgi:hypothetical protein